MSRRDEMFMVIVDAYGDYCEANPDPDHCPEPWAERAQEILGSDRANEIFAARAKWPPPEPSPLSPRAQQWTDAIVETPPGLHIGNAEWDAEMDGKPLARSKAAFLLSQAVRDPELLAAINAAAQRIREADHG